MATHPEDTKSQEALLASANAVVLGQIASALLHEIKNSLNSMSLTVQNLTADLQAETKLSTREEYIDRLSSVLSEIERLDGLARQFQTPQQSLRPTKEPRYLNEIVNQTLQLLDSAVRSKRLRLQARLDPRLNPPLDSAGGRPLLVDGRQIQQVLINLILNAIEASSERTPLLIETRLLTRYAEIRVTDYGYGVSDEVRARLFTPFSSTKEKGTGLGLFLSRFLIEENHGGTIEILPASGSRGATFVIRLPSPVPQETRTESALPTTVFKGHPPPDLERILLVEDEAMAREALSKLLVRSGFHVKKAKGSLGAIRSLDKSNFGLVLMDILLDGEADGIETAGKIQRKNPLVSFIFISAYAGDPVYRRRAQESRLRIGGWFDKPVNAHELIPAIRRELLKNQIRAALRSTQGDRVHLRESLNTFKAILPPAIFEEILEEIKALDEPKEQSRSHE